MAENVHSDIIINVDTSVGIAEIKNLQRQISSLNTQLMQSGAAQAKSAQNIQRNLLNNINATGQFAARVKTIASTTETFTTRLEKNKLGMGEYFRYAGASTKTFGRLFRSEFDTIEKVARERVKTLQTQYIKLGRDANGALKAISVRPLALDMEDLATKTAMAAQKQQLMNQLLKQGSTNLLNFGKNTQWAGRQLMVGFSIPLAYLGTAAAKTFMKMEEQAIRFKRVYGEAFTSNDETDKMLDQVKRLAGEFTKYGVAVEDTMKMAANAAAMGKQGADLLAQINQATRLAVLGGVEQEQALETTISLTNAFGIAAENLAGKINFLNAVENQTVTSIEDLTIAVPKAGPVIQQLGGDVEDLAFFLTAMKEGGINASEGANALKSGLASLINPTKKASEMLGSMGINITGIVEANKGDVKGTVIGFAKALDTLDPLNRARAIEQLFGKFQFARLSTLFQNVIAEGSQASKVLSLTNATTQELAILSERELKRVQDSPMYKFKKVIEDLKVSLVPLGEAFLKAVTPIAEFVKGFLDKFNSMGDGAKQFAVIATTVIAGIGPVLLMTFGLIANGAANLIKLFLGVSKIFQRTGKGSQTLGSQTEYMTQQQLEAAAVAASLDQTHGKLIQTFTSEAGAVNKLADAYARAVVAQSKLAGVNIGAVAAKSKTPKKYASGVVSVPGPKGAGDVVPAMLSPGEAVIPAKMATKYSGLINGMIDGSIAEHSDGKKANVRYNAAAAGIKESAISQFSREYSEKYGVVEGGKIFKAEEAILRAEIDAAHAALKAKGLSDRQIASALQVDRSHVAQVDKSIPDPRLWGIETTKRELGLFNNIMVQKVKESPRNAATIKEFLIKTGSTESRANAIMQKISNGVSPDNKDWGRLQTAYAAIDSAISRGEKLNLSPGIRSYFGAASEALLARQKAVQKIDPRILKIIDRDRDEAQKYADKVMGGKAPEKNAAPRPPKKMSTSSMEAKKKQIAQEISLRSILDNGTDNNQKMASRGKTSLISKLFGRRYANGVVEVPGPKGAGDIIPAMLSPGEAVIPTKMSKKYAPLISGMIKGTLPGFFGGFDPNYDPKTDPMNEMSGYMLDAPPGSDPFSSGNSNIGSNGLLAPAPGSDPFGASGSFDDYEKENKKLGGKFGDAFKEKVLPAAAQFGKNASSEMVAGAKTVGKNIWERSKRGALEAGARALSNTRIGQSISGGAGITSQSGKTYVAGAEVRTDKNGVQYGYIPGVGKTSVEKAQAASVDPKAAKQNAREKFGARTQKVGMIGMAGSMAVSAAAMLPGEAGKTAGDIAPLLLGLSSLAMLVQGPVSAALATLAAAIALPVYAMFKSNEAFGQAQDKALALGEAMGVGSNAILKFAEFSGNVTSKEIMDRRRSEGFDGFQVKNGKNTYGKSFLASDAGKGLLDSVQKTKAASGDKAAIDQITSQMATSVSSGAMSAAQARSVVAQLAQEMGDYSFGIQVNSELISLLGPKGENLLEDPLTVRVKMLNDQQKNVKDSVAEMNKIAIKGFQGTGAAIGGAIAGGIAGAGIGAAIGSILPGPGTAVGAAIGGVIGLVSGGITGAIAGNVEHQKELATVSAATVEIQKNALDQQQQISDSLEMEYEKRIAAAEAAGDLVKKEELLKDLAKARLAIMTENGDLNKQIMDSYKNAQDEETKKALMSGAEKAVKKTYKGTAQEDTANLALSRIDQSKATAEQKYMLKLELSNKSIDPSQMLKIMAMSQQDQNIVIGIATKYGGATANEVSTLTSMFIDPVTKKPVESVQTDFLLKINQSKTPEEFKDTMEFYKKVAQSGAVLNTAVVTDYLLKNPKVAQKLDTMFDKLRDTKGKITLKVLADVVGAKEMEAINDDIAYFETLSDNEKKIYTQVLATTLQTTTIADPKFKNWLSSEGQKYANEPAGKQLSEYAQWNAQTVTEANKAAGTVDSFVNPPADQSGGKKENPLDSILSRLKMIRDASINAAGGIKELRRVVGKTGGTNIASFTGVEQNLIKRENVSQEFLDFYDGLDAKAKATYVSISGRGTKAVAKLTADGKAVLRGLREISLGDYQVGLVKQRQDLINSAKAFNMLKNAGMSSADAMEVSKDAALANAIATSTNKKEVLDLVAAYNNLAKAQTAADKFQKTFDEANAAWDAKRNKLELEFDINTEAFQKAVTDAQNEIAKKTNEAGGLDDLQAGLTEIGWAEDQINKKYDLRSEALDRVAKANEKILAAQKGQLTIADALSRGDISAAAAAIQEQQARGSQDAISAQRELLDDARKSELGGLTATVNGAKMTRKEIEAKILTIEKEIFAIEEKRLEPANESIRLKEVEKAAALKSLDLQEREWKILENDIALAATAAWDYVAALKEAQGLAARAVLDATDGQVGTPGGFSTVMVDGEKFRTESASGITAAKSTTAKPATISPKATSSKAKVSAPAVTPKLAANQTSFVDKNGKTVIATTTTRPGTGVYNGSQFIPAKTDIVYTYRSMGGIIPQYLANGGTPLGTDIVPAMLTPGEFVMSKYSVDSFGVDKLKAINNGTYSGESVYNYELNVNVRSDANADEIARSVMTQIKQIDSQRLRGNRL